MKKDNSSKRNRLSPFVGSGASNHSNKERVADDFYSTDPIAVDYLLQYETFNHNIWEPACGTGNISKRLEDYGYNVLSTDIIDRGFGGGRIDFLQCHKPFKGDIITNPPFNKSMEFVTKALELSDRKVAMFLKLQFLETKKRYDHIFKDKPLARVYVFVKRIRCFRNDVWNNDTSAVAYAWFIWDKEYSGETRIRWIDNE